MKNTLNRILTDRDSLRLPDEQVSGEGYITLSARIARAGIQIYRGHELAEHLDADMDPESPYRVYRPEIEVFAVDALESFAGLPVTLGHPDAEVNADNYMQFAVGHVIGQPIRDGDFIRAELTIRDAAAITLIKSGERNELSVGYHASIHLESGETPDGQSFDAVQTQIRGNHIALVDAARCGPACRIGDQITDCDCASCQSNKGRPMSEKPDMAMVDGTEIPLAEAVEKLREANRRMAEALKDAEATIETLSSELETKKGEVEAMETKPTTDAGFAQRVQARADMLSQAGALLGDHAALMTLSDSDIRRRVINHIYGDGFASGASEHALIGMYKVAVRDSAASADTLNGRVAPHIHTQSYLQAALTRRNDRLRNAWKGNA